MPIFDSDACLEPDGLTWAAVEAAERERAGFVSFRVVSWLDVDHRLNDDWARRPVQLLGLCSARLAAGD